MADTDHLKQTLEHYRQLRQQKLDQVKEELTPIELMIRQLERDLGETSNGDIPALSVSASDSFTFSDSASVNKMPSIRPDEFFTMTQSEAHLRYRHLPWLPPDRAPAECVRSGLEVLF